MLLIPGEKIHLISRRGFDQDLRRHFAGEVVECTDTAMRVEGYVFILDPATNDFVRRPERRTRIVSLTDANNLINIIPGNVDLESLVYRTSAKGRLVITDGDSFELDINEFGSVR
jgi:hypothetical protein